MGWVSAVNKMLPLPQSKQKELQAPYLLQKLCTILQNWLISLWRSLNEWHLLAQGVFIVCLLNRRNGCCSSRWITARWALNARCQPSFSSGYNFYSFSSFFNACGNPLISCSLWQNLWARIISCCLTGLHGQSRSMQIFEWPCFSGMVFHIQLASDRSFACPATLPHVLRCQQAPLGLYKLRERSYLGNHFRKSGKLPRKSALKECTVGQGAIIVI